MNNLNFLKTDDERLQTEESKNKIQKIKTFIDKLTDVLVSTHSVGCNVEDRPSTTIPDNKQPLEGQATSQ